MKQLRFYRKLIQVGGERTTSFQITLPREWVRDRGLVAGDILEVAVLPDTSLTVRVVASEQAEATKYESEN